MSIRLLRSVWTLQAQRNVLSKRTNLQRSLTSYAIGGITKIQPISKLCPTAVAVGGTSSCANVINQERFASEVAQNRNPQREAQQKPKSLQDLLDDIQNIYNINGRLIYEKIVYLLEQLEQEPDSFNPLLTPQQAEFLLSGCGTLMPTLQPAQRLEIFERMWAYLSRHGQLTVPHFQVKLKVLQFNRLPLVDFRDFLGEVSKIDAEAADTPEMYAELLAVACCSGNMQQATELLTASRDKEYPLTEQNFNMLILGNGRMKDLKGLESVVSNMQAAGVPMSIETQSMLIIAYLENGAPEKALELLNKYTQQFEIPQLLEILRTAVYVELSAEIVAQLVKEFPKSYLTGTEVPIGLRNVCVELVHNGKLDTITSIISNIPKPVFNENQDIDTFGVFLLTELFRANIDTKEIIKFCNLLIESEKNARALHIVTDIANRRIPGKVMPFLQELAKVEPLRPHYFWPLLLHNFRKQGETGVLRTLKQMAELQVPVDNETLHHYVLTRLSIMLDNPLQTVKLLDEAGIKPSQMLLPIVVHLIGQLRIDEVIKLMDLYPTRLDTKQLIHPLTQLAVNTKVTRRYNKYARLVATLVQKREDPKIDFVGHLLVNMLETKQNMLENLDAFQHFLRDFHKFALTISSTAANTIRGLLERENSGAGKDERLMHIFKLLDQMQRDHLVLTNAVQNTGSGSSSFIKHPREMSLSELECHIIELESKGLNTRGVLRRLLQLYVRDGNCEKALEVKQKCDKLGVHQSAGMLASIFEMYVKMKDLPKAEKALQNLHRQYPGFEIDAHKIIDYAALLVHEGLLDAGLKLMRERASTNKPITGDYILKNLWNFLNNVAHVAAKTDGLSKERNLTREAFSTLQQLGYCRNHNTLLGPVVREYLLRGNIQAAIAEFRQLAEQFKHTPLQYELLALLVRLSNSDPEEVKRYDIDVDEAQRLLTEVMEVVRNVHGPVNLNSALLLAFAEAGTDNQLRRLLINPEFRINRDLLWKNCEHLGQVGAMQTLLRLARCARGVHHVIDEQSIYDLLLQHFVKENNHVAALDLYERLEADDELKISQSFLRGLVNLLRINKIEVPSNIALRAQVI